MGTKLFINVISILLISCSSLVDKQSANKDVEFGSFHAVVELENVVYSYIPPDNGSGPMWAYGNSSIIRYGNKVFASGMETIKGVKGYNNTRWNLYQLKNDKWKLLHSDPLEHTREPSPLGVFSDGRIFMSVNPTLKKYTDGWPLSNPHLLEFNTGNPAQKPVALMPDWEGYPTFNHHSYRSLAVDGENYGLILFNHDTSSALQWAYYKDNEWISKGKLAWPWGAFYEEHQSIRICYPAVQLKGGQVHFLGVSDIVEPNKAWKEYKFALTGRTWDYDFRRLFYVYSKDISTGEFSEWIEIASREETAGHIYPCDLWIENEEMVHILWYEQSLDYRLREKFFPDEEYTISLNYGVIENGKIIFQTPIFKMIENESNSQPYRGRFHISEDNRLFVIYYQYNFNRSGENRIVEISKDHQISDAQIINLSIPLRVFYTATPRNGSTPSRYLDLLGDDDNNNIRYVRIKI